jgi:hypothetical protein
MGRRPLLAMVLGWLSVVVAVGAITFVVVDRAGRGVGRASAAGTVALLESTAQSSTTAAAPSPTPSETEEEPPSESEEPSSTPAPSRTTKPRQTAPAPAPTPREEEPSTASFTNDGGTVVASCRGSEISLDSIRPRDGWRFEKEVEHGGLEVVFKAVEREVEMMLVCVRGVPTQGGS